MQSALQLVSNEVIWREDGTVVLRIEGQQTMAAGRQYTFLLPITNPTSPPTSLEDRLFISATGSATISPTPLRFTPLSSSSPPTSTPISTTPAPAASAAGGSRIAQQFPYPLANNTLTLTLVVAANLAGVRESVLTVTGLTGSETGDGELRLSDVGGSGATLIFGDTGGH